MAVPTVIVDIATLTDFRWEDLFDTSRPIELEIGCGKAGFLLRRAQDRPDRNFFGIEWAGEYYRYAVDRMQRWGMTNVRLLRSDASHFIRHVCPSASLTVLHVYHPDPWPKRRHWKRRLFQQPFVDAAVACLVPEGHWSIQTDHAQYFDHIRELVLGHEQLREVPFEDPEVGIVGEGAETNFEVKYRRAGRPIYQLAVRKKAD